MDELAKPSTVTKWVNVIFDKIVLLNIEIINLWSIYESIQEADEVPLLTVLNEKGLLFSESYDLFEILSINKTKLVSTKSGRSSTGNMVSIVSNQDTITEEIDDVRNYIIILSFKSNYSK